MPDTPFNPNSVTDWINVLHNAAAVPKGHADYDEARQVVALAGRKIAFLNRSANRAEVGTPDERETFRMSAVENTAGDVADIAASSLGSLPEVGPLLEGTGLLDRIRRPARQLAGFLALLAKDADLGAYERGKEAHPTAAAAGELTGPALMALLGGLSRRSLARGISERLKPLPETPPARPRGYLPTGR